MCQNRKTSNITEIYGYIIVTPGGALLFTTDPRPGQLLISQRTEFDNFRQFSVFLNSFGLLEGVKLKCCQLTITEAYQEFIVNRMLKDYGISKLPLSAPEVNALNHAAVNGTFNIWLDKARHWLSSLPRRVFYEP